MTDDALTRALRRAALIHALKEELNDLVEASAADDKSLPDLARLIATSPPTDSIH